MSAYLESRDTFSRSRFRRDMILWSLMLWLTVASCSSSYPVDVCQCSEITRSNPYDICLIDKKSHIVLLGPAVKFRHAMGSNAAVISNLKSQALVDVPDGPGHEYWKDGDATNAQGYFLHRCGSPLVSLGMDYEIAMTKAAELVKEGNDTQDRERKN